MSHSPPAPPHALARARRWIAIAAGASASLYVVAAAWGGLARTGAALSGFDWPLYGLVLATTLGNYALRYAKWTWLLRRVGVTVPARANLAIFAVGLAMTLSPAKAGELVKPWLVRRASGAALARTIPVLVAERVTDALAILALAAVGAGVLASDHLAALAAPIAIVLGGVAVIAVRPASDAALRGLSRVPLLGRAAPRLREVLGALRACLAPGALVAMFALSVAAWALEGVGAWLVLRGLGIEADALVATFVYASATALGAASPGGVGVADGALVEGLRRFVPGVDAGSATAAALLVRVATLWFGVLLGAVALIGLDRWVPAFRPPGDADPAPPQSARS